MLSEIESFAQRIEDLAVEVRDQDSFKQQLSFPVKIIKKLGAEFHAGKTADWQLCSFERILNVKIHKKSRGFHICLFCFERLWRVLRTRRRFDRCGPLNCFLQAPCLRPTSVTITNMCIIIHV